MFVVVLRERCVCEGPRWLPGYLNMQFQKAELEHNEGTQMRKIKLQLQSISLLLKEHPRISQGFISAVWLMTLFIS